MKLTTEAGKLLDALKAVAPRARGNSSEIMRHIRFDVTATELRLTAHDGSSSSEALMAVEADGEWTCAIPADAIVRLAGALPSTSHVDIVLDGVAVSVKSGRSRYKLPVMATDAFPSALACVDGVVVDLTADDVERLFGRVREALDPRDSRPFGQGLYLHVADGGLCSSGISLFHFVRLSGKAAAPDIAGVIVPLSAIDEITKVCKAGGRLTVSTKTIAAEAGSLRFCSKLIEQRYPDYHRALPALRQTFIEVFRLDALTAVKRLTAIADKDSVIDLSFGENEIVASLVGLGDGTENIPCEGSAKGSVMSIAAQRLVEMLEMPRGEKLQLHVTPGSMLLRIHDASDPTSIFVESTRIPKLTMAAA